MQSPSTKGAPDHEKGPPPVAQRLGYLLKQTSQAFRHRMDQALAPLGLTTAQYALLSHLREFPRMTNAQLARRAFITPQTSIRVLVGLQKRGLVLRDQAEVVNRASPAWLSQEGIKLLEEANLQVMEIETRLSKDFSLEEQTALAHQLQRALANLAP